MLQLVRFFFDDNNLVPCRIWWREIVVKHESVSKYVVQDCVSQLVGVNQDFGRDRLTKS